MMPLLGELMMPSLENYLPSLTSGWSPTGCTSLFWDETGCMKLCYMDVLTLALFHLYNDYSAAFRYSLSAPTSLDYSDESLYAECVVAANSRELTVGQLAVVSKEVDDEVLDLGLQRSSYNIKRAKFPR